MSGIKALTPTSAGFAQVFDTSQYVEEAKRTRVQVQEKLSKTMLQYDPKGLMRNHVSAYQELMEEYQGFVADNHSKLINSSENMETWQQKQAYENEIKNFIAGSSQMNQDYYRALPLTLKDDSYISVKNEDMMKGMLQQGTVQQFRDGELFAPVMEGLERNFLADVPKLLNDLEDTAATVGKYDPDKSSLYKQAGLNVAVISNQMEYEDALIDKKLEEYYNAPNRDGGDYRKRWNEEAGGIDAFKDDMKSQLQVNIGEKLIGLGAKGKTGVSEMPTGWYDATPKVGSSRLLYEFQQADQGLGMTDLDDKNLKRQRGLATVNKSIDEKTGKETVKTGGGNVLTLDGMNIKITGALVNGENLTTGKPLTPDEAQIYKHSQVLEVGNYWRTIDDVYIELTNKNTLTVEAGGFMPNLKVMLDKGEITNDEYKRILVYGDGRLVTPAEGAVLLSAPDEVSLMQRAAGMKYTEEKMKSEGGAVYTIVPLDTVKSSINSSINTKRTKLAEATGGDPLGAWMQEHEIKLDETYMSFFTGNKAKEAQTGLRQ